MPRTATYGLFNLSRIPFGLVYYFFPIWVLRRGDGHLLFEESQSRLIDNAEMPPSSFFVTDPLLMFLTGCAIWAVFAARRELGIRWIQAMAIQAGFAVPCALMLTAISMNFRYRIEFYPFMEFGAFLGSVVLCRARLSRGAAIWTGLAAVILAAVGVLGSVLVLLLYTLSDLGPAIESLRGGVSNYFAARLPNYHPHLAEWLALMTSHRIGH